MSTEDVPTPLKVWVRGYDNAQLGTGDEEKRAKTKKDSEHHELMVQAFPWLAYLDKERGYDPGPKRARTGSSADAVAQVELPEPDEETLLRALDDLEKHRDVVADEGGLDQCEFAVRVRGRKTPSAGQAAGADGLQGQTRTELALGFCKRGGDCRQRTR